MTYVLFHNRHIANCMQDPQQFTEPTELHVFFVSFKCIKQSVCWLMMALLCNVLATPWCGCARRRATLWLRASPLGKVPEAAGHRVLARSAARHYGAILN